MVETENGTTRVAEPWDAISWLGRCFQGVEDVAAGVKSRSEVLEGKVWPVGGRRNSDGPRHRYCQQWGLSLWIKLR